MNTDFAAINEGDDVEVVVAINARGGAEVGRLRDHTTGATWEFGVRKTMWRSLFR